MIKVIIQRYKGDIMLLSNSLREKFFKYPYIETIFIIAGYLLIGYYVSPDDMLMLKIDFSFLTIVLAIITLFHGISSGLLAMLILAVVTQYGYKEPNFFLFLREFVLVLVFGEFHYYWSRIINQHATEDKFTRQKLSELSKAFYMLKISHDQIEKSYVVKPMSLRNSILDIKNHFDKDHGKKFYQDFLQLLQKTLNIESSFLLSIDNEKKDHQIALLASFQEEEIDTQDLLIQDAFKKLMPLYVSSDDAYSGSKYLAAIPAVQNGKTIGMLVINKMPFMSFNKDNLISATILISYMFNEINKMKILKNMEGFIPIFQSNFRFESYRLYQLNRDFGTETTMLLFKSYNAMSTHLLKESVDKNLRTLDIMTSSQRDGFDIVAVLFPFADKTSVDGFINRVYSGVGIKKGENDINHTSLSIRDIELVREYVGCDTEPQEVSPQKNFSLINSELNNSLQKFADNLSLKEDSYHTHKAFG